ncbi:MAG: diguanylate cyclase [Alphaproteobacteria bacterium]|nr:diguanylate cyclase [Alphaproteobacteria bacterium]
MLDSIIVAVFLFVLLCVVTIAIILFFQGKNLREKLNLLLEENAKLAEEADQFAEVAKNPLGPIFSKNAFPLILSFDTKGKIIGANDELLKKFGYTRRALVGKNALGTILPKPEKESDNIVKRLFANPNLFIDTETETTTKMGDRLWVSWTNKIVYNDRGKAISADAVGFDITKRKNMEAELQYLSSIDPQTGVMNRHALLETGTIELKRAKRYHRTISVAVIKFAVQNKNADFSDKQLKDAVALARRVIRSVDYIGRIGDVEFALILPETAIENIPFLIQRLREHLKNYNHKAPTKLALTYGSSTYKKQTDTIDALLGQAWRQLNTNKHKG